MDVRLRRPKLSCCEEVDEDFGDICEDEVDDFDDFDGGPDNNCGVELGHCPGEDVVDKFSTGHGSSFEIVVVCPVSQD